MSISKSTIPSWVQPFLIGLSITVFTTVSTLFINKMSELSSNIQKLNVNIEQINGRLSTIDNEMMHFKRFREATEQSNSERDKAINSLQQSVGILEERIKIKK